MSGEWFRSQLYQDLGMNIGVVAVLMGVGIGSVIAQEPAPAANPAPAPVPAPAADQGRELFHREWTPNDPRIGPGGGDGLGPVFNARSCVACHRLGGAGGAGAIDRNIDIVTARSARDSMFFSAPSFSYAFRIGPAGRFEYRIGNGDQRDDARNQGILDPGLLVQIHPGFLHERSIVLHRSANDPAYRDWRAKVPGVHDNIIVRLSQRNPTPLFGVGLIDAIPDRVIEAAARRRSVSPAVSGRVSRLPDGRVGKFGWKAQTASLKEFNSQASASEIGLETPDHHQAADPRSPGAEAARGLDLTAAQLDALTSFVRSLPRPIVETGDGQLARAGKNVFRSTGCVACHLPKLGEVDGLYSDLLLHDMGPSARDVGNYGVFAAGSADQAPQRPGRREQAAPPSESEWRTPPLWGLSASAPYWHDGRARTIDQAIALHDGEAAASAQRHARLSDREKQQLRAFLDSLAPPRQVAPQ